MRARRRVQDGTADLVMTGPGHVASVKHGAFSRDVDTAALERLSDPALPDYLSLPAFSQAASIAFRRLEMAARVAEYVASMDVEEQLTPLKAGSSSPAEIARHLDDSALRALTVVGLTPQSAARFGRALSRQQRPDIALLAMEAAGEETA